MATTDPADRPGEYVYHPGHFPHTAGYLWPTVFTELNRLNLPAGDRRVFEVGCGNGALTHEMVRRGWSSTGIDPSVSGIAEAQKSGGGEFHVAPGGVAIVSTPYHGYWKNLGIALRGKFDAHMSPLWDHGHIKFWSVATLTALLKETGFEVLRFHRLGRIPVFAKSMVAVARRPR